MKAAACIDYLQNNIHWFAGNTMGCSSSQEAGVHNPPPQAVDNHVPPSVETVDSNRMAETVNTAVIPIEETVNDPNTTYDDPKLDTGQVEGPSETGTNISNNNNPHNTSGAKNPCATPQTNNNNPVNNPAASPSQGRDDTSQEQFQQSMRSACLLMKPETLFRCANKNVYKLVLHRALPHHIKLTDLLRKLSNLQVKH